MLEANLLSPCPQNQQQATEEFKCANEIIVAANGGHYFTDQRQSGLRSPTGRVFRRAAAGKLECVVSGYPRTERHRDCQGHELPSAKPSAAVPDFRLLLLSDAPGAADSSTALSFVEAFEIARRQKSVSRG